MPRTLDAAAPVKADHADKLLYEKLVETARIPGASASKVVNDSLVVRGLFVDLSDVLSAIAEAETDVRDVGVYADVLFVPAGCEPVIDRCGFLIVARRIDVADGELSVKLSGENAILTIVAAEATKPIKARIDSSAPAGSKAVVAAAFENPSSERTYLGESYSVTNLARGAGRDGGKLDPSKPVVPSGTEPVWSLRRSTFDRYDEDQLAPATPLELLLSTQHLAAVSLVSDDKARTEGVLRWIGRVTRGVAAADDLNRATAESLVELKAWSAKVDFVPYLDRTIYQKIATDYLTAAGAYERQYDRFTDKSSTASDQAAAAKEMLSHYKDLVDLRDDLIAQAKKESKDAEATVANAEDAFDLQKQAVDRARIGFEVGLEAYKTRKIIEAVFTCCKALIELVSGFATILTSGSPTALEKAVESSKAAANEAAAAAKSAEEAAKQAAAAAKAAEEAVNAARRTGEAVQEIEVVAVQAAEAAATTAEAAVRATKTVSILGRISGFIAKLGEWSHELTKMKAAIDEIIQTSIDTSSSAKRENPVVLPETRTLVSPADWDCFRIDAVATLRKAVEEKIDGAEEFQAALEKWAIRGNDLLAAQVASLKASQGLARLYLQRKVEEKQRLRLEKTVANYTAKADERDEMARVFLERSLNMKRWIYSAILNYRAAFRYDSLRDSSVRPALLRPVADLYADLARAAKEFADAKSSLNPRPQEFRRIITLDAKEIVDGLATKRRAEFQFTLTNAEFLQLGRVRLNTVRVRLKGIENDPGKPVSVSVSTGGVYRDRLGGVDFAFTAEPMKWVFQYDGASIVLDGRIDARDRDLYYEPTPFTSWNVAVPESANPGLDLKSLSGLEIEFAGSAVATFLTKAAPGGTP